MKAKHKNLWVLGVALLVGVGGILYGYDIGVISGALMFINKSIFMTKIQTGLIVGAVLGGGLFGTLIAGRMADQLGRRFVIMVSSFIFIIGIFLILLAHSFATLLIARLFLGVGVGIVAVAVPLYVTELVPADHRGRYVTFFQLFLTLGILLANLVDLLFLASGNWRGMFSIVLIPAIVLLLGMLRLPESPRWLAANSKMEKARQVLRRTHSKHEAESSLIEIITSLQEVQGSWHELFSPQVIKALFIAVSVAILNQWTGINTFLQFAPSLLKASGVSSNVVAMMGSIGIAALNFLCTMLALFLVDRLGRRPLLIVGVAGVFISEVFLGTINYIHLTPHLRGLLSIYGFFGFIVFFAIGPGVVVWLAVSELFPTRIRGKGIAVCLFFNSLAGTCLATVFLTITKDIGWAGAYWLCAGFSFLYLLLATFLLPETKKKSLEKIQKYFYNDQAKTAMAQQKKAADF